MITIEISGLTSGQAGIVSALCRDAALNETRRALASDKLGARGKRLDRWVRVVNKAATIAEDRTGYRATIVDVAVIVARLCDRYYS